MPTIEFGSKAIADEYRSRVQTHLSASDDARTKSINLKPSTPDTIVDRLENEAYSSERFDSIGAGMTSLSQDEKRSLQRQHGSFNWQDNGFEAMRAKAALEEKGVTEWEDYYEPGEGVRGSLNNLQASKKQSSRSGASIGVGGDYTDEEEMDGRRRRQKQAEQLQAGQVEGAKEPAFTGDDDAIGFLREEEIFSDDVFDISFRSDYGPSGRDFERLQDAHESRPERAQTIDERRSAKVTRDPLTWAQNKSTYDFPGIDTIDPQKIHEQRPKRARTVDERNIAPQADSREQWVRHPDQYDWGKVDAPDSWGATMDTPIPMEELERDVPTPNTPESEASLAEDDEWLVNVREWEDNDTPQWRAVDETDPDMGSDVPVVDVGTFYGNDDVLDEMDQRGQDAAMPEFVDNRDKQGSLAGFGMDTDGSQYRESRQAVEQASEFGVDDRSDASRGFDVGSGDSGDQGGLGMFDDAEDTAKGLFEF